MGADPVSLLGKLEPGREIAAGTVRGLAGALDALVAAGLVAVRTEGRAKLVTLTAAGEARRAAPPAPPARTPRTRAPTGAAQLAAIAARLDELVARVERLERAAAGAPAADLGAVKSAVLDTVADLDAHGRLGGLVPIPELRAALRARGVGDDGAVTAALESLEQEWRIDLNVAQAPTAVADRAAGIERPGRGLLYYVSRR